MKILLALLAVLVSGCSFKPVHKWPAPHTNEILHLCWDENHTFAPAKYDCDNPEPIEWKQGFPLTVTADAFTSKKTAAAVRIWNEWLGFHALTFDPLAINADIRVQYGGPRAPLGFPNAAGVALFATTDSKQGRKQVSLILIFDSGLKEPETFMHELGHSLGLSHDHENPRSIMHPSLGGQFMPSLELRDRAVLRLRYHRL